MGPEQTLAQKVDALCRPLLAHHGVELILVENIAQGHILRLYIDREGGVTLADCGQMSRLVGDMLDAASGDAAPGKWGLGKYTLEVSSPGLDRPLVRPEHFQKFLGRQVRVMTLSPVVALSCHKLVGELVSADTCRVQVKVDGMTHTLEYEQIKLARLLPVF